MLDEDRLILQIADRLYLREGSRLNDIRRETGLTDTAFWARVVRLIRDPDAQQAEPEVTGRLQRLLAHRQQQRRAG